MVIKENNEKTPAKFPSPQQPSLPEASVKPHLIDCPACGANISNQAPICPHCGHPIATNSNPQPLQLEEKPVLDSSETNSQVEREDEEYRPDPYAKKAYEEIKRKEKEEMITGVISFVIMGGFFIFCMQQCSSCIDTTGDTINTLYKSAVSVSTEQNTQTSTYDYWGNGLEIQSNNYGDNIGLYQEEPQDSYTDYIPISFIGGSYTLWAPSFFKPEYSGNDIHCYSADGNMSLSVFEESNPANISAKEMYNTVLSLEKDKNTDLTYKVCYSDRFYVSGFMPDSLAFYRHTRFHGGKIYTYILEWQKSVHKYGVDILNEKIIRFDFGDDKDAETSKK